MSSTDKLVLGTVNASWKNKIDAKTLAEAIGGGAIEPDLVHVATFFSEVRPHLILRFAQEHRISKATLKAAYKKAVALTNEANPDLEKALVSVG